MDSKTLIQALKRVVREEIRSVIKEELTEILREGLQSTITEMKKPGRTTNTTGHRNTTPAPKRKPTVQFSENKWASVLNETEALIEQGQPVKSVFSQLASSIFSWGTALSVGVTLLTVYGKEIGNFFKSIFEGVDSIIKQIYS